MEEHRDTRPDPSSVIARFSYRAGSVQSQSQRVVDIVVDKEVGGLFAPLMEQLDTMMEKAEDRAEDYNSD